MREKVRAAYKTGLSYSEISDMYGIARSTISYHCADLARKKIKKQKRSTKMKKIIRRLKRSRIIYKHKTASYPYEGFYYYVQKQKDGRRRVLMFNRTTKKTKYKLLARYRLEVKLKRFLTDEETVDHIDEDKTNDKISNLQILSRTENAMKSALHKNPSINSIRKCVICGTELERRSRGVTCSRRCRGVYSARRRA